MPAKDTDDSKKLPVKSITSQSLPVSQPDGISNLKSEQTVDIQFFVNLWSAISDKTNMWIHLSSTADSGPNYATEVVSKLQALANSLGFPKIPFSEHKLIQYLTDEPLESIYDRFEDADQTESCHEVESIVLFQSTSTLVCVSIHFLEFDTIMSDHASLKILKQT